MPTYNPTEKKYLTVSQSRTNNGQKDIRIILDTENNVFYTLDDDNNFNEIQTTQDTGMTTTKHFYNLVTQDTNNLNSVIVNDGAPVSGLTKASNGITLIDDSIFQINKDGYYEITTTIQINALTGYLYISVNDVIQYDSLMGIFVDGNEQFNFTFIYNLSNGDEVKINYYDSSGQWPTLTIDRYEVDSFITAGVSIIIKEL